MSDYVIVGAGAAGCALAARLSEDPSVEVTLLEAGPPDTAQEIHVPAAFPSLFLTEYDWDYDTAPEPGLDGRRAFLPRGRALGGSSSINAMVYIRGHRADYDEWSDHGCEGWSYDELLPYFKRSEDNERGADAYHGVGGPLSVSEGRSRHPFGDAWISAAVASGLAVNTDFNGAEQEGVGRYQVTQRGGMRCSAAVAFLHPAMERSNLHVTTGAHATRLELSRGRAVGVHYLHEGQERLARADREVILCGGAYNSPQLLMLSGIGPAATLSALGIAVVADLPVGENLQDHPMVVAVLATTHDTLASAGTAENAALLQSEGRGPLTSNIAEVGGFLTTRAGLDAPDVQFLSAPVAYMYEGLAPAPEPGVSMACCLNKPSSRGVVGLRSANPLAKPLIQHNYLTTDEDMASLVAGLKVTLDISRRPSVAEFGRRWLNGPTATGEDDLVAWIRSHTQTNYHPVGTCAMGTVVDSELRVLGIDGLRVADASVMPSVPRGNTNAPSIMVGEKAADLIRGIRSAAAG
ncbi:MAG TPA: FAD-dependent oxidoreductase [Solirubrobacteraceae bacterium]|nr:FAD-dependent oxidoreductase [Solirubrobacteraceae bacterium]